LVDNDLGDVPSNCPPCLTAHARCSVCVGVDGDHAGHNMDERLRRPARDGVKHGLQLPLQLRLQLQIHFQSTHNVGDHPALSPSLLALSQFIPSSVDVPLRVTQAASHAQRNIGAPIGLVMTSHYPVIPWLQMHTVRLVTTFEAGCSCILLPMSQSLKVSELQLQDHCL
jgi:hypothetical protein